MRTQKFDLYALGVGSGTNPSQLEDVASESGYVFTPNTYTALDGMYRRLVQVIIFGGKCILELWLKCLLVGSVSFAGPYNASLLGLTHTQG